MGLLDFVKKKELEEIKRLKAELIALERYNSIIDIDKEIERKQADFKNKETKLNESINTLKKEYVELKINYDEAFKLFTSLKKQNALYEESLELADYGIYAPHFDFNTSDEFKEKIFEVRERQKDKVKSETAVLGGEGISWNGSLSEGQAMVKRETKLMLRAFNGECDSFIYSVDWNNIAKMEERILKSFDAINKVFEKQYIRIALEYYNLKIEELRLTYEYKAKKQEEKEEQRAIKEQMREEEKALREIEKAQKDAEKEEETYQKALEKARTELEKATGDNQEKMLLKIQELEERLKEAEMNKERALSMAQQTRRGHVYVISNIGSFGEDVYKIGMTRRLDPLDRVKELGDASVPFGFDVHALIFSNDAPTLETTLHKEFENKRVNMVNQRREFFNVTLQEIENIVIKNHGKIEFTKIAEAEEYRETLAIKHKLTNEIPNVGVDFPSSIN